MAGRLKLKSIYPTFEEFSTFCMDTITEFYPRLVTDMPNSSTLKSEIERYVFKPLYRQFKNATCRYLPTEEGIDAFNNQFSNQLEEVVFDFLVYTSTNLHYFNESYTKVGENLEQGVTTYNSPINQDITNTKSNTTIAKGATAQNINLMVYNGNTSWLKAFSSYYTPQRKAELIDKFRWLFISFYVGSDEGVTLVELSEALSMANGDMVITPEENEILRKVIIEKPETLIPENIKNGVNIGGVEGSLDEGVIPSGILEITENGLYNVADKEGVNVNVVAELAVDNGMIYEGKYRVRYFDIDGTILKIEYVEDGGKLTPPAKTPNYDPDYLIFDEWNYDIENYVVEQPIDVGATYKTVNDATYMFCRFTIKTGLKPTLNITGFTSIDWGDGTVDTNTSHTYAEEGKYLIKISGEITFNVGSTKYLLGSSELNPALEKVYLKKGVTNLDDYLFQICYSLQVISIPKGVTTFGKQMCQNNYSLRFIIIPKGFIETKEKAFASCSIDGFSIPVGVTTLGQNTFAYNYGRKEVVLNRIQNLSSRMLTNNNNTNTICIYNVPVIDSFAFVYCYATKDYFILGDIIPVLNASNAFDGINNNCIFWVDDNLIDRLKVATNWSAFAYRMKPLSWYPSLTNPNE